MRSEVTGVGIIPTEGRTESIGTDNVTWKETLEQGVSASSPREGWHGRDEGEENSLKEHRRRQGKPQESSYGSQNKIISRTKECSVPQRETCQMRVRKDWWRQTDSSHGSCSGVFLPSCFSSIPISLDFNCHREGVGGGWREGWGGNNCHRPFFC